MENYPSCGIPCKERQAKVQITICMFPESFRGI